MQAQNEIDSIKVKKYLNKYLKELQRHFEISDESMRKILKEIYTELAPENFIKFSVSMIKSLYNKIKLKRKNNAS